MAVLMGSVPPGLTFQDLVGGRSPRASLTSEHGRRTRAASRDRLMRIHLPDGVVREMTLTQYREFLVSYRFTRGTGSDAVPEGGLRVTVQDSSRRSAAAASV